MIVWFAVAAFATWRVTHLVAREAGPWDVLLRLREGLGRTFWGELMDCFKCLSVWVAAPFAVFVGGFSAGTFVIWLGLSGAAILLEDAVHKPALLEEVVDDELLRSRSAGLSGGGGGGDDYAPSDGAHRVPGDQARGAVFHRDPA
ncbi:MAG: hypothetical protein HY763_01830 [Planctomycetes bacterium]|nr:hypothetical protein [Planctomycetota bacterium]